MTNSRSSIIGLSNEVSFVSESCVVSEQQLKTFCKKLPVWYILSTSVHCKVLEHVVVQLIKGHAKKKFQEISLVISLKKVGVHPLSATLI